MRPSKSNRFAGWSAYLSAAAIIITLILRFDTISAIASIFIGLAILPVSFALYKLERASNPMLSLAALVAGGVAALIVAFLQTLLVFKGISSEQSDKIVTIAFGVFGISLAVFNYLAYSNKSFPARLAIWGLVAGAGSVILTLGDLIGGQEHPVTYVGALVVVVGYPVWSIWIGKLLLSGKISESQTGDSTSTIKKHKTSNQVIESQPKRTPATNPAAKKRAAPMGNAAGHIFISYRRSDSADIAGRIDDRLTGRFGRNLIFKDVDSIPLGLDFKEYLDEKVSECSVFLAIIGDRWLEAGDETGVRRLNDPADFVRIEIESALKRGIPVIPLLVRGARMPMEGQLPDGLKKLAYRNGIPIRHDPDFHRDMDRLITALEKHIS